MRAYRELRKRVLRYGFDTAKIDRSAVDIDRDEPDSAASMGACIG